MLHSISSELITKMFVLARATMKNAYAPYSKFYVGACICSIDDELFVGCNIENASYGLTICAERCAISNMISVGKKNIKAVLLTSSGNFIITPCGACRQVIREFAALDAAIYLCDDKQVREMVTLEELLPKSFGPNLLEKKYD